MPRRSAQRSAAADNQSHAARPKAPVPSATGSRGASTQYANFYEDVGTDKELRRPRNDELLALSLPHNAVGAASLADAVFLLPRWALVTLSRYCGCVEAVIGLVALLLSLALFSQCWIWTSVLVFILSFVFSLFSCCLFLCNVSLADHATRSCFVRNVFLSFIILLVTLLFFVLYASLRSGADTVVLVSEDEKGDIILPTPCADAITRIMGAVAVSGVLSAALCCLRLFCFPVIYTSASSELARLFRPPTQRELQNA